MKLHFFGKKSMSLKRFYRYVLITILLVILCFVLTAVCLTFISQKNKILTHTHSVLANIAEEYQGIEKNFWTLYMPIFENRDTYQKVYDYFSNQTDFEHSPINRKELHGVLHLMTNRDYRIAWIAFYSPLREENYVYVTSEDSLLKLDGESPIWNDLKSKNRPMELYGAKIASDIGLTFHTFSVGGGLPSEMGSGAILVGYPGTSSQTRAAIFMIHWAFIPTPHQMSKTADFVPYSVPSTMRCLHLGSITSFPFTSTRSAFI